MNSPWIELPPVRDDVKTLKRFGLLVGPAACVLGLALLAKGRGAGTAALFAGCALILFGLLDPARLKGVHRVWMMAAFLMGWVMSRVLLTFFYYAVVTPVGLLMRGSGKDPLERARDPGGAATYWIAKAKKPDIRNQF